MHHGAANVEASDGRYRFVIEQGDFMHRPSRINIEVKGKPGAIEEVRVGGPSVVVAHGEVVLLRKSEVSSSKVQSLFMVSIAYAELRQG